MPGRDADPILNQVLDYVEGRVPWPAATVALNPAPASNLPSGASLQRIAGDLLARFSRSDGEKISLYTGTAPVWSNNAASQIAGGILRGPKRAAGSGDYPAQAAVATDTDPYFAYLNIPSNVLAYGTAFPDYFGTGAPLLTGGAGQAARWWPRIAFFYDGQTFEWYGKAVTATAYARLRIDGKLVSLDVSAMGSGLTPGNTYYFKCDLGSQAIRLIEIDAPVQDPRFGGIVVEPTATISRGPTPSLRGVALADSIGGGAGVSPTGFSRMASWVGALAELMGGDVAIANAGIGATGYSTSVGVSDYITRVPDVVAVNPDFVLIEGGQNDSGTAANLQALATTLFQTIRAQLPNALIFVIGCYSPSTPGATKVGYDLALRAAATSGIAGCYFISWIDPSDATAAGSGVVAWTTATMYRIGDVVLDANGAPWSCINDHTSAGGALDATKFRPTAVIFGTGKVGTPANDGNADVGIQADGIHPAPRGCLTLARATYYGMRRVLRAAMLSG